MIINIFKILAVVGLLILTWGILSKDRKTQNMYFAGGGILLVIYSITIKDAIIISVQTIFTLAAVYELVKLNFKNK